MNTQQPILPSLTVSVSGLGYVGLPLALAFARKFHVVAFDVSEQRADELRRGHDRNADVDKSAFEGLDIEFTSDASLLARANFHVIAVPTPVDDACTPDLSLLFAATTTVARLLKKGDTVVIESSVYPGCTEEECLPILEKISGLRANSDFNLAYSPERINPGDKSHSLKSVPKVVAGHTPQALDVAARAYATVVDAGVYRAQSIKVAEAAKIIENTQRDVNIALMNEASLIFARMGIDTRQVIEAASTKWNFLPFHPGLVGGHCIGVDPYYLDYKARQLGYHTQVISSGRFVNDSMGAYVARETLKRLHSPHIATARILIMGLTYKQNVSDVRNTRVAGIVQELRSFGVGNIDILDPVASKEAARELYGYEVMDEAVGVYDAVVVATAHDAFGTLGQDFFAHHLKPGGVLSDVYGIFAGVKGFETWRL